MDGEGVLLSGKPPTGGPSPGREVAKTWWRTLGARFDAALDAIRLHDSFQRRPRVVVHGEQDEAWLHWFASRGAKVGVGDGACELTVALDLIAQQLPGAAVEQLRAMHGQLLVGGRMFLVERVVRGRGLPARDVGDVMTVLSRATGGAVVLADLEAVVRPGEIHPTTVILELIRLRSAGDDR